MTRPAARGQYEEYLSKQTLAFSKTKQSAFIGFLFDESTGLYKHYAAIMDASWFTDPEHQALFKMFKEFHERYKKIPTQLDLKDSNILASKDIPVANKIRSLIDQSIVDRQSYLCEALIDELEEWKDAKIFSNAITKSADSYNKSKFDECATIFREAIKTQADLTFTKSEIKQATDINEILDSIDGTAAVPFGLSLLDNHFAPNNTNGGLMLGDTTLMMGSSNGGKTTTMLNVCVHNVFAENHSLLMTHEGTHADIRQKYIRCYLSLMTVDEVQKVLQCDERRAAAMVKFCWESGSSKTLFSKNLKEEGMLLHPFLEHLDKYITYLPYNKSEMLIEKLTPIIERHQTMLKGRTGKGYKLLASDYPALVGTELASKGRMDVRHRIDYVYQVYVQMALEHGWHSLVNSQSNRQGSKVNSRVDGETRFLGMEDNAEAFGPVQTATNVITINRSPEAQQAGRVYLKIVKSRSSDTGLIVASTCDFAKCITHSNDPRFGQMSFYGNSEYANVLDTYLVPGVRRALTPEERVGGNFEKEEK